MSMIWDLVLTVFCHLPLLVSERKYWIAEALVDVVGERIA